MEPKNTGQSEELNDVNFPSGRGVPDPRRSWNYRSPAPVFAADGQEIGVLSLGSPGDYLVVQRGADGPDLYIPLSAINRSDTSGVYLSLTRADLRDKRWLAPPK